MDNEGELVLATYIGFEFDGDEMARKFSTLDEEQQDEVRLLVQDTILNYWDQAAEEDPSLIEAIEEFAIGDMPQDEEPLGEG